MKTIVLYRASSNRRGDSTRMYVSELPGHGGADWGYTSDRQKALKVTPQTAKRFAAMCKHVGARWFGSQPA